MTLITKVLHKDVEIHSVPLEKIEITDTFIKISYDDIDENRIEVTIHTYQAFRTTTIDCVSAQDYHNEFCYRDGIYHRTFLDKAHHYFLLLGDNIIEFIAFDNYTLKKDIKK